MNAINTAVQAAMLPKQNATAEVKFEVLPEDQLPKDAKKHAIDAIDRAYDIQFGKGGILDTSKQLVELKDKVSELVYGVAKEAVSLAGKNLRIARAMFLGLCAVAEAHIKSRHVEKKSEELPIGQLIPQWSTYKSTIAKGLEKGMDPETRNEIGNALKFPTGTAYRNAVLEASKPGSQAGTQRANNKDSPVLELVSRGWSGKLSAAMQVLCEEFQALTSSEQDLMAPLVVELAGKVHTFRNEQIAATKAKREAEGIPTPTPAVEPAKTDEAEQAAAKAPKHHGKRRHKVA